MKTYTIEGLGEVIATNNELYPLNILMLEMNVHEMQATIAEPVSVYKWVKHKLKMHLSANSDYWFIVLHGKRLRSDNFIKVNVGE
nr:MAG TPA: hypothetical protein [Caudoviricetes sp.]